MRNFVHMIQYVIKPVDGKTISGQVAALLALGAGWITLHMPDDASDAEVAGAIREAVGACGDSGVILIVRGKPQLVLDTVAPGDVRAGGVLISAAHGAPARVRELLGPHAIIGYEAASADEILPLAGEDIDYFTLPAGAMTPALGAVDIPIVATGASALPDGFSAYIKEI